MTDRLPGSPGKYSAVVAGGELQKMQTGKPFAITLQLDDDPVREGTPYSKAAVLPDELAAKLCPETEDPAPKDAIRGLWEKKADSIRSKSGTVIAIEDSAHTPLKGLKLFGKTIQNGTPTPTAPVELESVGASGNIGVTVAGKNMLAAAAAGSKISNGITFTSNGDGSYSVKGTAEKGVSIFFPLEENCVFAEGIYVHLMNNVSAGHNAACVFWFSDGAKSSWAFTPANRIGAPTSGIGKTITQIGVSVQSGYTVDVTFSPMFVFSNIATDFEPYKSIQTLTASTPNGLPGIPVSSGGNYTDENGQQWVCDEIDFARGVYVQRVGRIGSYADESIATPYISSTGSLSTGATVLYVLEEFSTTALSAEELEAYALLHTNTPNTTILNDAGADMEISYYTPNAAVPVVFTPKDAGKVLSIDEHGCVALTNQKDRIVEQGTSGNWTYRKWDSGIAECWLKYTTTVDISSGSSPVWDKFYRSYTSEISLPVVFAEMPMFNVSVFGDAPVIYDGTSYVSNSVVNMIQLKSFVRAEDTSKSYSITHCVHAIGRWK